MYILVAHDCIMTVSARLLASAFLCGLMAACAAQMPPVHMTVVDHDSGQPVAGAWVLFVGPSHAGTITGHGGKIANLFLAETVTDSAGSINIPSQRFPRNVFFANTNYDWPQMLIFKPGYRNEHFSYMGPLGQLKSDTTWPYNGKTIVMKHALTEEDRYDALYWMAEFMGWPLLSPPVMAYQYAAPCSWMVVPRTLVEFDRLATAWNEQHASSKRVESPLQGLIEAAHYSRSNMDPRCGDPGELVKRGARSN